MLSSTFIGVSHGWAIAATLGVILGAAYMLWLVQRLFYGPESALTASKPAADLRFGELAVLWPLAVLMLVMGLSAVALASVHREGHSALPQSSGSDRLACIQSARFTHMGRASGESCSRHLSASSPRSFSP